MLILIKKQLETSRIIYKLTRSTLTYNPKAGTSRRSQKKKIGDEIGAENHAQKLPNYQILSPKWNPAKRTTPMSPERSKI